MQKRVFLKRSVALAAAFAAGALILTGCGEKSEPTPSAQTSAAPAAGASAAKDDLLARVMKKGEITIATEGTWAPWTYHDEKNALTGFDVELGRQIAAKLGVKAHFIEGKWDGLLAGISAGRFDIMINGVDVTPERSKAFLFTEPYAFNRTVVMTKTDSDKVKTLDDLKGLNVSVQLGSISHDRAKKIPGAKITTFESGADAMLNMISGNADAVINAQPATDYMIVSRPSLQTKLERLDFVADAVPMAMIFPKNRADLQKAVNKALAEIRADGTYEKLHMKWFGRPKQ